MSLTSQLARVSLRDGAAAVVMSLALAACGGSASNDALSGFDTVGLLSGEVATIDGVTFDPSTVQGSDLVARFWAPW